VGSPFVAIVVVHASSGIEDDVVVEHGVGDVADRPCRTPRAAKLAGIRNDISERADGSVLELLVAVDLEIVLIGGGGAYKRWT
jgi:hypothetical protein